MQLMEIDVFCRPTLAQRPLMNTEQPRNLWHLPPNILDKDFCLVIVHDNQTRSMLQPDQGKLSLSTQSKGVKTNINGSLNGYFGPNTPDGMENNWVQTTPGKGWIMLLRLYGSLEPLLNKTWKPCKIEMQE